MFAKYLLGMFVMALSVIVPEITPVPVLVVLFPALALTTYIFARGDL